MHLKNFKNKIFERSKFKASLKNNNNKLKLVFNRVFLSRLLEPTML